MESKETKYDLQSRNNMPVLIWLKIQMCQNILENPN